jgi:hypothetical protein
MVYANNLNVFDKDLGENGLAGEMDLLVVDAEGNLSIIDIKTAQKATWDNFNTDDPEKFSKKYAYSVQQTIYRNLLFNMLGKKATIKLLPIELKYNIDGEISSAKLANITDDGKNTIQLIPVDEVDNYVPLKDIKEVTDELSKEDRASIQKAIDLLENDLVMERDINLDQEKADEIIKQIEELQAILDKEKGPETPPTTDDKAVIEGQVGTSNYSVIDGLIFYNNADTTVTPVANPKGEDVLKVIKADIERRTQEDLNFNKITKSSTGISAPALWSSLAEIQQKIENDFKGNPSLSISTYIKNNKAVSKYTQEKINEFNIALENVINAKYDAELTALGKPVDTSKTSIADAKKIIKPTTGLGDLLIEVDEEGDTVIPKFEDILKPMSSARKISDLMIAYSDAIIAVTEGNIPGDKNALVNAIELKFNEKQVALGTKVSNKNLSKDDYLIAKKPIFDGIKGDIFIVESVTDNKIKIRPLTGKKSYTTTSDVLTDNFKKHNKMAYEIKEEVTITPEDKAAVVETKNNLDDIKKDAEALNNAKENSKSVSKSDRLSKLKNNSNNC